MSGRSSFSLLELETIRGLLRDLRRADRSRQKSIRARLRTLGFYITDYTTDQRGFTASDLEELIARGTITVTDKASGPAKGRRAEPETVERAERAAATGAGPYLTWYEELRQRYRPKQVKVLLIAESPPDPGSGQRRFFYSPQLTIDNLYRGVAEAVYGQEPGFDISDKPEVLNRLKADGYWLIDAVERPINKESNAARRAAIRAAAQDLVERCRSIDPQRGIIICHALVHKLTAPTLRRAGITILHDAPLPFPLGNWRRQFVRGFRACLR